MHTIPIKDDRIFLGRQGENHARRVLFSKPSRWRAQFGEGRVELLHQRSGDDAPYPVVLTEENGATYWYPSSADTAIAGEGKCELRYRVSDVIVKSSLFRTTVLQSLGDGSEEPPEVARPWVDQVLDAAEKVEDATTHQPVIGDNGNWYVWEFESGEYIDTGVKASGGEGNGYSKEEINNMVLKSVDLTKVTTVTEGEIEITENSLTGITGGVSWKKCVINLTGYVDFEFEYRGIEGCYITINGGYRQSVWENDGRATFSYKGVINEPLLLEIYATEAIYFTKYNTTTDYELHNKVEEEINSKILKTVDLTKVTTFGATNESNEVTFDFIKGSGKYTINVVGYVELEIEPLSSSSIANIVINGVTYKMNEGVVTFKGVVNETITGRLSNVFEGMRFKKFVTSTDYELHNKVGDFDAALDAAIALCDKYIGGEIE